MLAGIAKTILANDTSRIYAFRTLIVACIVSFASRLSLRLDGSLAFEQRLTCGHDPCVIQVWLFSILLWWCIIVHHIASIFALRFLYEIVDWLLLSFELSCWFALRLYTISVDRWASQSLVVLAGALFVQLSSLMVLWIFRTAAIIMSRGRNLFLPFNFFSQCDTVRQSRLPRSIMFGKSLWRSRIRDESRVVKSLRALFAMCLLAGLLLFGAYAMIIDPVRETAAVPSKVFHTADPLYDLSMAAPVWSIIAFMDMDIPAASRVDDFKAAVKVIPLWDDSDPQKPQCQHLPGNQTYGGYVSGVQTDPYVQIITIFCPNRLGNDLSLIDTVYARSSMTTPDLLIVVNFTALGITSDTFIDTRLSAVSIVVGLTNNTADVLDSTSPTPLVPGTYLFGGVSREFRRRFVKPPMAALGVLTLSNKSSRTFQVGNIVALTADPSPLVPRVNNTATLRLYGQEDVSDWVITEDYRENSVWGGFAAVGGFWTFINGMFAIVFGSQLMLLLCGIKPFSVSGIADCFQRDRYREAWQKDFPHLRTEGGLRGSEQAGFVAFLREHLIDLDLMYGDAGDDLESQHQSSITINQPLPHIAMIALPSSSLNVSEILLSV